MKLSEHFSLDEFLFSATAARMGRVVEPTPNQVAEATRLCQTVLQPIRTRYGKPLAVISGIRPKWLNDEVGGSESSAHMWGGAVDIRAVGMSSPVFARWIVLNCPDVPYDQVIDEFGSWVHIGISKDEPRKQFLIARKVDGKTVYTTD